MVKRNLTDVDYGRLLEFRTGLRRFVTAPRAIRAFNIAMGVLLALSLVPVFLETWQ